MSREIKFRAWAKTRQEMVHLNPYEISGSARELNDLVSDGGWFVMQYTGLKDKNGVEIYEGDIVGIEPPEGRGGLHRGIVDWEGDGFAIDRTLSGQRVGGHNLWFLRNELTVIGNIYENPELLPQSNAA